jgi:serine phosphatase RsbU (regulator of sigma subunit)
MVTGQRSTAPMLVFAKTKTGERLPVEVMVSPIRDSRDQVVGGIEIFRDLSEAMNDLRRARAIQLHTMETPAAQDPRVAIHVRYIPHELVGGDFYRVERIDEDRYAVMIADVSGHGLASALYTMQLRSLWEEYRPVLGDPAALLSALNSRLYLFANRDDQFATALHAVIDASRREFRWACAGHLPPLLVSKHPAASRFLPLRGQALGMMTHASYAWDACRLKPDDAILLYTDGAIEILNARQQELGDEGLRRLAAPVDLHRGAAALEALEESLLSYSNEVRLQDDLTLLSIQCPAAGDG